MDFEKIRARLDKLVAEGRKGELRGALSMLNEVDKMCIRDSLHIGRVGDGKGFPLAGDIRVRARRRRAQALDVLRARGHDFRSGAGELLIPAFQRFQVACAQKLVALLE